MTPAGRKAIIADLERLLGQHELPFRPVRAGLPHRTVYARAITDDLSVHLLLHWDSGREWFCFEVGWLFRSTFDGIGSCFDATNALRRDAVILPMGVLAGTGAEHWWDRRATGAATDVAPAVAEAFAEVLRLGMPYLDRVITAKLPGGSNPLPDGVL